MAMLTTFKKWKLVPDNPEAWLRWFMEKPEIQEKVDERAKEIIVEYMARKKAAEVLKGAGYSEKLQMGTVPQHLKDDEK